MENNRYSVLNQFVNGVELTPKDWEILARHVATDPNLRRDVVREEGVLLLKVFRESPFGLLKQTQVPLEIAKMFGYPGD